MSKHYDKGIILYGQGRYDLSETEFRKSVSEDPDDANSHAMLALSLIQLKQLGKARKEVKEAVRLGPLNSFAHYVASTLELHAGAVPAAEKSIREAIRLYPTAAEYYGRLANIKIVLRKWKESVPIAEQGLAHDPQDIDCLNAKARALLHMGDHVEAERLLNLALSIDPNISLSHSSLGWLYVRTNRVDQGINQFREALRLSPNSQWAYEGIVHALKSRNPIYQTLLSCSLRFQESGRSWRAALLWTCAIVPPLRCLMFLMLFLTLLSNALFTLLLRLDPVGRRILTDESKRRNNLACILLLALIVLIGFGWQIKDEPRPRPSAEQIKNVQALDISDKKHYVDYINARVRLYWMPPAVKEHKEVTADFAIAADGKIQNLKVVQPSGVQDLDRAAKSAIQQAAPFRLPPFAEHGLNMRYTLIAEPAEN